jgi:dolichol kinase
VILALARLVVGTALLWKHAVVALAIATVCSLAAGVMFQKVDPSKAIGGAIAAFILMFVFSWLALQMADPLLFETESDLSRWIKGFVNG